MAIPAGCAETPAPGELDSAGTAWASDTEGDTSAIPEFILEVEGWGTVEGHGCPALDRDCYARAVCEAVTGERCLFDLYDCREGADEPDGAYYPESMSAGDLNFALRAAIVVVDVGFYGNICSCDADLLATYGLKTSPNEACAVGEWRALIPPKG